MLNLTQMKARRHAPPTEKPPVHDEARLPRDKMPRHQEILDKYGSVGASPYKIDTASFVVETRYGVWGAQAPLKPKGYSKKKRTFGPVELQFMDGVEGRFVGLLPESEKQNLH